VALDVDPLPPGTKALLDKAEMQTASGDSVKANDNFAKAVKAVAKHPSLDGWLAIAASAAKAGNAGIQAEAVLNAAKLAERTKDSSHLDRLWTAIAAVPAKGSVPALSEALAHVRTVIGTMSDVQRLSQFCHTVIDHTTRTEIWNDHLQTLGSAMVALTKSEEGIKALPKATEAYKQLYIRAYESPWAARTADIARVEAVAAARKELAAAVKVVAPTIPAETLVDLVQGFPSNAIHDRKILAPLAVSRAIEDQRADLVERLRADHLVDFADACDAVASLGDTKAMATVKPDYFSATEYWQALRSQYPAIAATAIARGDSEGLKALADHLDKNADKFAGRVYDGSKPILPFVGYVVPPEYKAFQKWVHKAIKTMQDQPFAFTANKNTDVAAHAAKAVLTSAEIRRISIYAAEGYQPVPTPPQDMGKLSDVLSQPQKDLIESLRPKPVARPRPRY
jgi:hypothetical protein